MGAIEKWAAEHNQLKQQGFYVDVSQDGVILAPSGDSAPETVAEVIGHVHQIGWQLRLGEHIEAKAQAERERDTSPAAEADVEETLALFRDALDPEAMGDIVKSMRAGTRGIRHNNAPYLLRLPELETNPFANIGTPGHEAETRELARLAEPPSAMEAEVDEIEPES